MVLNINSSSPYFCLKKGIKIDTLKSRKKIVSLLELHIKLMGREISNSLFKFLFLRSRRLRTLRSEVSEGSEGFLPCPLVSYYLKYYYYYKKPIITVVQKL